MRPCLNDEELFALVDGAVAGKDAELLRRHIEVCERCGKSHRALERAMACLAEEEQLDVSVHADAVLAALDRSVVAERPRPWRRRVPFAIGAVAAAAALFVGIGIGRNPEEGFTARGAPPSAIGSASLRRSIAVTVETLDGDVPRALEAGSRVTRDTRFVVSHRNTSRGTAHALVFAIDAKGAVHWLYPAYESAGSDPSSVLLGPTAGREVVMGSAVSFDDMSVGRLAIVTVLSREPLRVSQIEGRSVMSLDALRRDLPRTEITSIEVLVSER
jgi:anti-sigma factor RsiW